MKCPKCGETRKQYPNGIVSWGRKDSAYHCGNCNTYWTEWQQSEITRLQERIRVLEKGLLFIKNHPMKKSKRGDSLSMREYSRGITNCSLMAAAALKEGKDD